MIYRVFILGSKQILYKVSYGELFILWLFLLSNIQYLNNKSQKGSRFMDKFLVIFNEQRKIQIGDLHSQANSDDNECS